MGNSKSYADANTAASFVSSGLVLRLDPGNMSSYDASENLVTHSTYNASTWTNIFPAGATLTTGISDPLGGTTAVRLSGTNTTNSLLRVSFPNFTPSTSELITISVYIRRISGTTAINWNGESGLFMDLADTPPSGNYLSQLITNQWVRVFFTSRSTNAAKGFIDLLSDNRNDYVLDFWGVQVERNANMGTYRPTSGTVAARTSTTWNDLSGSGYNFTVSPLAYNSGDGGHMNFETATTGIAKRVVGGVLTDMPMTENSTFMIFSTIKNTVDDWRTLLRGTANDHQVIAENGSTRLGMYDNDGIAGPANRDFRSGGFDIEMMNDPYSKINCLTFKFKRSSTPHWRMHVNSSILADGIITTSQSMTSGFSAIGGYHMENANPLSAVQFWGRIYLILHYDRELTDNEIKQNFAFFRTRFGLT
jgi:hypothetical protein